MLSEEVLRLVALESALLCFVLCFLLEGGAVVGDDDPIEDWLECRDGLA